MGVPSLRRTKTIIRQLIHMIEIISTELIPKVLTDGAVVIQEVYNQ